MEKLRNLKGIMLIITTVLFVLLFFQIRYVFLCGVADFIPFYLLIFLPFFVSLAGLIYISRRTYRKSAKARTFYIILLIISVILMIFTYSSFYIANTFVIITDISLYEKAYHIHDYKDRIDHFPKHITDDMSYPRIFSSGVENDFVLAYTTDSEKFTAEKEKFSSLAIASGGIDFEFIEEISENKAHYTLPYPGDGTFSYDSVVYVLDYKIESFGTYDSDFPESKGFIRGVAFSDERREIIYFDSSWIN